LILLTRGRDERQLILQDGFPPESIKIEVHSRTRSISSIEESFVWTPARVEIEAL
jgi:hypothetical protein